VVAVEVEEEVVARTSVVEDSFPAEEDEVVEDVPVARRVVVQSLVVLWEVLVGNDPGAG